MTREEAFAAAALTGLLARRPDVDPSNRASDHIRADAWKWAAAMEADAVAKEKHLADKKFAKNLGCSGCGGTLDTHPNLKACVPTPLQRAAMVTSFPETVIVNADGTTDPPNARLLGAEARAAGIFREVPPTDAAP